MSKSLVRRWMDAITIASEARGPYKFGGDDPFLGMDCSGLGNFIINYCGFRSGLTSVNSITRETANSLMRKFFTRPALLTSVKPADFVVDPTNGSYGPDNRFADGTGGMLYAVAWPNNDDFTHIMFSFGTDLVAEWQIDDYVLTETKSTNGAFQSELIDKLARRLNGVDVRSEVYWLITKMFLLNYYSVDSLVPLNDPGFPLAVFNWHEATPATGLTGYTLAQAKAGVDCPHTFLSHGTAPLTKAQVSTFFSLAEPAAITANWLETNKVAILANRKVAEIDEGWWTNVYFTQRGGAILAKAVNYGNELSLSGIFDNSRAWVDETMAPAMNALGGENVLTYILLSVVRGFSSLGWALSGVETNGYRLMTGQQLYGQLAAGLPYTHYIDRATGGFRMHNVNASSTYIEHELTEANGYTHSFYLSFDAYTKYATNLDIDSATAILPTGGEGFSYPTRLA